MIKSQYDPTLLLLYWMLYIIMFDLQDRRTGQTDIVKREEGEVYSRKNS